MLLRRKAPNTEKGKPFGTSVVVANPFIPWVTESNWLERVAAMTEKPNVTIAKYHAFNLTQAKPISNPIPAESKPPARSG